MGEFEKRIENYEKKVLGKPHKIPFTQKKFYGPVFDLKALDFIYASDGLMAWIDEAEQDFPTLFDAKKRFDEMPQKVKGIPKERLYSVARAYYDLTQEYKQKWFSDDGQTTRQSTSV